MRHANIHDSFVVYTILETRTTANVHTAGLIRAQAKYMCKQWRIVWMEVGRGRRRRRRQFDNNCVEHFNSTETSVSSVALSVPIPTQSQWRQAATRQRLWNFFSCVCGGVCVVYLSLACIPSSHITVLCLVRTSHACTHQTKLII